MAASQEQKLDFLLKKIGYTASKTGIAEDETGISGTKKAPFAEPIPSPLTLPGANVWAESNQIPTTPPNATTPIVRVYKTGTAQQLTFDSTVADNRSFVARETPGEVTSAVVGDWIDTQFGADYIVKVYKGEPGTAGVTTLFAAGSGNNDTWFFDYSAGVLNFNGTNVPSGITTTNIYIEGYRYTGIKGVTGIAQSFTELNVTGVSTFAGITTVTGETFFTKQLNVAGISTFNDNTIIDGTLTVGSNHSFITGGAPTDQGNLAVYGSGKNSLIIQTDSNSYDRGIAWRNSGDAYVAYIAAVNRGNSYADLRFGVHDTNNSNVNLVSERMRITREGNVGIGLTNPATKLDVHGSFHVSGNVGIKTTNPQSLLEVSARGDTEGGIFITDSNTANAAPYLRVLGKRRDNNTGQNFSGRVLLASLRTDGDTASTGINTGRRIGTIMFGGNHTDGSESNILYPASIAGVANSHFSSATAMPTDLVFYTGSTGRTATVSNLNSGEEKLRIAADGNVGINSTVPETKLDVIKSFANRTWTPGDSVVSMFERASFCRIAIVAGASSYSEIDFGDSNDDNAGYIRYDHSDDNMSFRVDRGEKLRITSDGKVGIGTTNPSALLHLHGSSPKLYFTDTDTNVLSQIDTDSGGGNFAINVDVNNVAGSDANFMVRFNQTHPVSAAKFIVKQTGKVGIGTGSPTEQLHLASDSAHQILLKRSGASPSEVVFGNEGNTARISNNTNGIDLRTGLTPSSSMLINRDGDVGIGTDDPQVKLHIQDTKHQIRLSHIESGSSFTDAGVIFKTNDSQLGGVFTEVDGEILSYGINVHQLESGINTSRVGGIFRLDTRIGGFGDSSCFVVKGRSIGTTVEHNSVVINLDDGNTFLSPSKGSVAIGTVANLGDARLTAEGVTTLTNTDQTVMVRDSNADNAIGRGGNIGFGAYVDGTMRTLAGIGALKTNAGNSFNGDLALYTRVNGEGNLSERLRITSDGHVGIGTDNPNQKLDIRDSDPRIQLVDTDNNESIQLRNSQGNFILSATKTSIFTGGGQKVLITSGGDVGIGTNNPGSKLDVVGNTKLRNDVDIDGNLDVDGTTTLDGLTVSEAAVFNNNLTTNGMLTISNNAPILKFNEVDNTKAYFIVGDSNSLSVRMDATGGGNIIQKWNSDGTHSFYNKVFFNDPIDALSDLKISGVSTFVGNAQFNGNVSIAGTLTYEDVTNIDSVGIITAQNGIHVTGAGVSVTGISTFNDNVEFKSYVAIGNLTNPDRRLHIQTNGNSYIRLTDNDITAETDSAVGAIEFETRDTNNQGVSALIGAYHENNQGKAYLKFNTGDASTISEKLRISSDGLVTIKNFTGTGLRLEGSGSNYQGLQLKTTDSSASQTRNVFIDAVNENGHAVANQVGSVESDGSSSWSWQTQSPGERTSRRVERFRITGIGSVGINSTAPQSMLDVIDNPVGRNWTPTSGVTAIFERNGGSIISLVSGNGAKCGIDFADSGDDNRGFIRYDHSDNSMFFRTNADEQLRITSTGNVGIGTSIPDGQLHISSGAGSNGDCRVYIEADADNTEEGSNPFIIFKNDGGYENASVWCGNAPDDYSSTNDNSLNLSAATSFGGGIRFFTSTTNNGWETAPERARITPDGEFLINATATRSYVDGAGYTQKPILQVESDSNVNTAISLRYDSGTGADTRRASFIFARTADGTAVSNDSVLGEVLFMGEGNNTLEKAASIRAEVDGTPGTNDMPGRLIFSTSADGEDSPTERLRIESGGDVGIGTNNPGSKLDVFGDIRVSSKIELRELPGGSFLDFDDDNAPTPFPTASNNVTLASISGMNLIYDTNNNDLNGFMIAHGNPNAGVSTAVLVIDADENVGIGTDNPSAKLDVRAAAFTKAVFKGTGANANNIGLFINSGNNSSQISNSATSVSESIKLNASTNSIVFDTANAEVLRIDSSGKVGIGTNAPAAKLEAYGTDASIIVHNQGESRGGIAGFENQRLAFVSTHMNDDLVFGYNTNNPPSTAGFVERMRIDNGTGNIGIGTISPGASLHIASTLPQIRLTDIDSGDVDHFISGSGSALVLKADEGQDDGATATTIRFHIDTEEKMRIESDGKVGIGTNNPTQKLEVKYGEAWIDNNSGDSIARSNGLTVSHAPGSNFTVGSDPGDAIRAASFMVKGSSRAAIVALRNADDNAAFWDFIADGNTNKFYIQRGSNAGAALGPAVTIDTSLNVGIGTNNPQTRLHIRQAVDNNTDGFRISRVNSAASYSQYIDTSARFNIGYSNPSTADPDPQITLNQDGKVGIGTNNPQALLDVSSDSPNIRITDLNSSAGAGNTSYTQLANLNGNTYVYTRANENNGSYLIGGHGDGVFDEFIRINSSGKVGINSTVPQALLDVEGTGTIAKFGSTDSTYETLFIRNNTAGYPAIANDSSDDTIELRSAGSVQVAIDYNNNKTDKYFRVVSNQQGSAGTEVFRVQEDGDVGINSTTPAAKLDVFKPYNGLGVGNAAARIYGIDSGVAETGIRFVEKGSNLHSSSTAYLMRGISNGTTQFVFGANGNVGIGSTIPTALLDVKGITKIGDYGQLQTVVGGQAILYYQNTMRLSTNGTGATFGGNLDFLGNHYKATFGASKDLEIFHGYDGTVDDLSVIRDVRAGVGTIVVEADNLFLRNKGGSQNYLEATNSGGNAKVKLTRTHVGGRASTAGNPNGQNYFKIGTWKGFTVSSRAKITIFGTASFNAGENVAGETVIYLALAADYTMHGHFHSVSHTMPGVQKVIYKLGNSNTEAEIWVKYQSNYSMTNCMVDVSIGTWEAADEDSGSTNVATGATDANIDSMYAIYTSDGTYSRQRLRIDSSGKIGIGQNNPATTLEIKSDANAQTTATIPTLRITNDDGSASAGDITGSVEFFTEDSSDANHISGFMRNISETNAGVNYSLVFGTKDSNITGDATEKLRILSNGKVGIGTVSPATDLHIHSGTPRITMSDSGTNAHHRINADSSVGNFNFDIDYNSVTSAPAFIVNIKGAEQARVSAGGSLAVGTSDPLDTLTIADFGVGNNVSLRIVDPTNVNYGAHFSFYDTDNEVRIGGIDNTVKRAVLRIHRDSPSDVLFVSSLGRLGVGNTNPTSKLTVTGDAKISGIVTASSFESTVAHGTAPFVVASSTKVDNLNADLLDGKSTANSKVGSTVVVRNAAGGFIAGDVTFDNLNVLGVSTLTGNVSIAGTLTYEDVTNVDSIGIITARDDIKLTAAEGKIEATGATGLTLNASDSSAFTRVRVAGNTRLHINSDGNVGIGSEIPLHKLDIRGNINFNNNMLISNAEIGNSNNIDHIWHSDTANYGTGGTWNFVSDGSAKQGGDSAIQIGYLKSGLGGHLLGNVGIGTTTPLSVLHIVRSTNPDEPCLVFPERGTNTRYSTGFGTKHVHNVGQRLDFYAGDSGSNTSNLGSSARRMSLTAQGRFGIGTTNPTGKLEVSASNMAGLRILDSHINSAAPYIEVIGKRQGTNNSQSFGGQLFLAALKTDNTAVHGNKRLGSVLFGGNHTDGSLSNIAYPASIGGIAGAGAGFTSVNHMPTDLVFNTGSVGRTPTTPNVNSGEERLRITSEGRVGIGITNPDSILHLYGGDASDCVLILEADRDNSGGENHNPYIVFAQDGGVQHSVIGVNPHNSSSQEDALVLSNSANANGGIIFRTNSSNGWANATERLTIASNGKSTFTGTVQIDGLLQLPTSDQGIKFGPGGSVNDDAHIEWRGTSNAGYLRISTSDDSDGSGANEYIEFGDYAQVNRTGPFTQHVRIARDQFLVRTGSNSITPEDRFLIDSSGKIGIKTTTPTAQLSIGNTTGNFINATGIQINRPHQLGLQNGVHVYTDNSYNQSAAYQTAAFKATAVSGIAFAASSGIGTTKPEGLGGELNARINFDGSSYFAGNMGIGTANPAAPLSIFSDADDEDLIYFDMGSPTQRRGWRFKQKQTGTITRLNLQADVNGKSFVVSDAAGTEHFEVATAASGSFVKIPGASQLDVNGSANFSGITTISSGSFDDNVTVGGRTYATNVDLRVSSMRSGIVLRNMNNYRTDNSVNSAFMVLDPFTSSSKTFAFRAAEGTGANDINTDVGYTTSTATLNDTFWVKTNGDGYFSGDIGIGNSAPSAKLHIGPVDGDTTPHLYLASANNDYGFRIDTDDLLGGNVPLRIFARFNGTDTERIRVKQTGEVGIGTVAPDHHLHVVQKSTDSYGTGVARFEYYDTDDGGGDQHYDVRFIPTGTYFKSFVTGAGTDFLIVDQDNTAGRKSFAVESNAGNRKAFTVDSAGNIGIGNDDPGQRLHIDNGSSPKDDGGILVQNVLYAANQDKPYLTVGSQNWTGATTNWGTFGFQHRIKVNSGGSPRVTIDNASGEIIAFHSSRNVGINTSEPTAKLQVVGSFAATTKSFVIDHPTKEGMKLRHGSLEGPENGVYVRGRLKDNNTIKLPDYWTGLVDEDTITVNLTPIGSESTLHKVIDIYDNTVVVGSEDGNINCFYTVFGERKDVEKMEVEY